MLYQLKLKQKAEKQLNNLRQSDKKKILKQLVFLSFDPFLGKKLKGELEEYYSLRAWPYRILYQINKGELLIFVFSIEHRQGVYK
jgi:mRNA interferase RelE/StbE